MWVAIAVKPSLSVTVK
ncbi:hypothetical protein D046_0716A, partial [Vibrio parahaemolyticus V-223/04]